MDARAPARPPGGTVPPPLVAGFAANNKRLEGAINELEGTGQIKAYNKGVAALMRQFPKMSHLETCRVVTR